MVNRSPKARNIGVLFDTSLSMIPHVDSICKTAFFHLHNIAKIRRFLTPDTKTIVHAFVTSKVDYCNTGLPRFLLQKLQRVLNCAARLVCHSRKFDNIIPIMIELHWLPIEQRVHFKILLITFKALNQLAPMYISNILSHYRPSRVLQSSNKNLLQTTKYKLERYGGRSFSVAAPFLWNALPDYLRNCGSLAIFKSKQKTFLFNKAYFN